MFVNLEIAFEHSIVANCINVLVFEVVQKATGCITEENNNSTFLLTFPMTTSSTGVGSAT